MDLSDESSRGSSKSSVRSNKSKNGNQSKSKTTVTPEQIEQFCAVTGSSEDVARNLIEACRGNLEMAVNMHMEGVAENPSVPGQEEDFVRAPIPQKQEVLVQQGYESYGFGFKGKRKVTKSVFDSFRNFEVETRLQESRLSGGNGHSSSSTPGTSASTAKLRSLEDLFRPPIDLIFKGNLLAARDAGKTHRKWVMVNVQNISEFACQVLNRDVWSQKSIKDLVRENFFFLQLYQDSEEGQRYMNFYKINTWPYVAVLDPRTGELLVEWNQKDSATYENLLNEFVATCSWGDDTAEARPSESKKMKLETILDASEDDQIQAAIRASLAAAQKKSEEESNSEDEEDEVEPWTDSESDSRASEPSRAAPSLPEASCTPSTDEDWRQHLGPDSDPHSSIVFRFPDGSKDQKSLPSSSTLMAVIKYVNSKGFPSEKYDLMANFPKRMLLTMDPSMTLKDAGLFPQEQIFVQSSR